MNYKIIIPSAGIGSRLKDLTKHKNKALVEVNNKPVISYILDQFDKNITIVVALGYQGADLKKYLIENHKDRNFEFVEINPFDGPESGLGLTMLQCKEKLQCPFIFIPNDTIVEEKIPEPKENWIGYSEINNIEQFRCIDLDENNNITALKEKKEPGNNLKPYIGLTGIHDYKTFWKIMTEGNRDEVIRVGESFGLKSLIKKNKVKALKFTWFDTGNLETLKKTRDRYEQL